MGDATQRDNFVKELAEKFPKDYIWADDDCVVFTMWAPQREEDEHVLRGIVQRYEHLFEEIESITMPGQFHTQLTFVRG